MPANCWWSRRPQTISVSVSAGKLERCRAAKSSWIDRCRKLYVKVDSKLSTRYPCTVHSLCVQRQSSRDWHATWHAPCRCHTCNLSHHQPYHTNPGPAKLQEYVFSKRRPKLGLIININTDSEIPWHKISILLAMAWVPSLHMSSQYLYKKPTLHCLEQCRLKSSLRANSEEPGRKALPESDSLCPERIWSG